MKKKNFPSPFLLGNIDWACRCWHEFPQLIGTKNDIRCDFRDSYFLHGYGDVPGDILRFLPYEPWRLSDKLQVRSGPLTVLQDAGDESAECESDGGLSIISTPPDPFVPSGLCFHFRLGNTRPSTRQLVHLQIPVPMPIHGSGMPCMMDGTVHIGLDTIADVLRLG